MELEKLINTLDADTKQAMEAAAFACVERHGIEISLEDLLLTLLNQSNELVDILTQFDIDISLFRADLHFEQDTRTSLSTKPVFSELLLQTLQNAWLVSSLELSISQLSAGAIILSLLRNQVRYGQRRYVKQLVKVSQEQLKALLIGRHQVVMENSARHSNVETGRDTGDLQQRDMEILERVSTSLTDQAEKQAIDPVIGRDQEIRQTIDILCRRRKNNPILLGEAGVGKTAVVEGLAQKIVKGEVPEELLNVDLRLLDLAALQAGASVKGEFERRVAELISAIQCSIRPVILFIDEAHLMVGAGANEGAGDVANLLKPALARGELRTIAATTWVEYKRYIEKDPALVRRFQSVKVGEPSIEQAIVLLRGLRSRYEKQHGVYIRDEALVAASTLSGRYLVGRQLPDKAIDLLDTACARVKAGLAGKPVAIENIELKIEAAHRKADALTRDQLNSGYPLTNDAAVDGQVDSEIDAILQHIDDLKLQLVAVESIWHQERTIIDALLETRAAIAVCNPEGGDSSPQLEMPLNASQRELLDQLKRLRTELEEIQGESPLLHYEVTAQQISEVLSSWTGIPAGKMLMDEAQKLSALSIELSQRVKGQERAISRIGELLCQARVGLNDPEKPLGVFLLVGPSGVGKTETALTIADTLFGGEAYLTTINMSEFQEKHTISRLIGSPPGYVGYGEGGVLTEAVRQKPFSVVLLDEVEKADPNVLNLFYQVFDKGTMNDGQGRLIDFRNTVIVMTSNLASDQIETLCLNEDAVEAEPIEGVTDDALMAQIRPSLNHFFKPALLARMEVLIYRPLLQHIMELLVEIKLRKLAQRLLSQGIQLDIDGAVFSAISRRCSVVEAGARHIDKVVNRHIMPKISRLILASIEQRTELKSIYLLVKGDAFVATASDNSVQLPQLA